MVFFRNMENKEPLEWFLVLLDNIIQAVSYPSIRLEGPERVVKGDILGSKIDVFTKNGVHGWSICQTINFLNNHT